MAWIGTTGTSSKPPAKNGSSRCPAALLHEALALPRLADSMHRPLSDPNSPLESVQDG